jgi:hypothetical protein
MSFYPTGLNSTSIAAADHVVRWYISKQDRLIIASVKTAEPHGLIREEISDRTEISIQSTCARCNELLRQGILIPKPALETLGSGFQQRKTKSGRLAQVLIVNPSHPEVA